MTTDAKTDDNAADDEGAKEAVQEPIIPANPKVLVVVEEYKSKLATLTEHEKAVLEQSLWDLTTAEERKIYGQREWLSGLLGGAMYQYAARYYLLNGGTFAAPLWDRVKKDLTISTANRLYRDARQRSKKSNYKKSVAETLAEVIAEYDQLPVSHSNRGDTYRKRAASNLKSFYATATTHSSKKEEPTSFWARMRKDISEYVLSHVDQSTLDDANRDRVDQIRRGLETSLKAAAEECQHRLSHLGKSGKKTKLVNRAAVIKACGVLAIDVPARGEPVNITVAAKKKRDLLRAYHPDSHGGKDTTREYFEDVVQAYDVLEVYNVQVQKPVRGRPAVAAGGTRTTVN